MAKRRSWHFYLFIFGISTFLVGYLLWTFTPIKDEVEARIIQRLQPYLGESFYITDFSIGPEAISFYKVRAADQQSNFSLEIEEIRIGFAADKLLSRYLQPHQSIESVEIIRPTLTLYYIEDRPPRERQLSLEQVFDEIITNIKKFEAIDHLTIREGSVLLQLPWGKQLPLSEKQIPLLNELGGRLNYIANREEITLNLQGEFLGTDSSFVNLQGQVDIPARDWTAVLNLDECFITSDLPFWKLGFWQIENARLEGDVQVNMSAFTLDSLSLQGKVLVKNLSTAIYNQHMMADSFYLQFDHHSVYIDTFDCRIEDGRGRFGGMIENIFRPTADWRLTVADYSASYLQQSHSIFDYLYEGKIAGEARFSGPLTALDIEARAFSPAVLYAVVPFNTTRVRLSYNTKEKILRFPYLRADFFTFRTQGTGTVNFNNDTLQLKLDSDIDIPRGYFSILNGLNEGQILVHTDFYGNFITKNFRGGFHYRLQGEDTLLVEGRGPLTLDDQLFNFTLHSNDFRDDFTVQGTIEKLFSGPVVEMLDVKDFPVHQLSNSGLVKWFVNNRHTNFYFAGPYHSLAAKMKIVPQREPLENILELSANIQDIFLDDQRFQGRFIAHTAPKKLAGDFEVAFSREGVDTRITVPNSFYGRLFMGATPASPCEGQVQIINTAVADFLENSPDIGNIFREGTLRGNLNIDGTMGNPRIAFDVLAQDFIIHKVGYYNARMTGTVRDQLLSLDELGVQLNSNSVLQADFRWDIQSDSARLAVRGQHIESNFLAETIFGDADVIRGNFSYSLLAEGPLRHPRVTAEATVQNGHLLNKNPFTVIAVALSDSVVAGLPFWQIDSHILKVNRFSYVHPSEYRVNGSGLLSIDPHQQLDFQLDIAGNVLAELPQLNPYFRTPQSDGQLFVHLQGSRANPHFKDIDLRIYNGSLEFDGVIPPLTQLKAEVELTNASEFIHIKTIEGLVGNRWGRIYNQPTAITAEEVELSPLRFEEVGLNLGVLVIQTEENGIPLAIPGMMEEGDIGYFATRGKLPGEKFYFAGPPTLPRARGTLVLYNSRVTFPFIGMYDESGEYAYDDNNKMIDFLMNMEWDILALPGNNNRYFVNIPGYVGEVFMDLNIDNSSAGLEFTGRLIDESFRVAGSVESLRGRVEYLDVKFQVERFGAEFNRFEIFPDVYGTAYTTVRTDQQFDPVFGVSGADSAGAGVAGQSVPRDILLKLYVIDPITGKEVSRGRWEDFRFKLESRENPAGETQEQLLAHLGYSFRNLQYKAGEVGLTMTQNFLIRPLFRPIERQLERQLKLDYVRLRSNFASNLFYMSFQNRTKLFSRPTFSLVNYNLDPALLLLQSSELTLGKYLIRDVYMTYTGELVSGYEESKLGMNHTVGLEYRLLYNLLLEVEVSKFQFNPFYNEDITNDFRIRLRHSFNF